MRCRASVLAAPAAPRAAHPVALASHAHRKGGAHLDGHIKLGALFRDDEHLAARRSNDRQLAAVSAAAHCGGRRQGRGRGVCACAWRWCRYRSALRLPGGGAVALLDGGGRRAKRHATLRASNSARSKGQLRCTGAVIRAGAANPCAPLTSHPHAQPGQGRHGRVLTPPRSPACLAPDRPDGKPQALPAALRSRCCQAGPLQGAQIGALGCRARSAGAPHRAQRGARPAACGVRRAETAAFHVATPAHKHARAPCRHV